MPEPATAEEGGRLRATTVLVLALVLLAVSTSRAGAQVSTGSTRGRQAAKAVALRRLQAIKDVAGQPIAFGTARYFGGVRPAEMGAGVIGIASGTNGHGYWLATADGSVLSFGDARSLTADEVPQAKAVAIVATGDADGYWLAYNTGVVVACGDAAFHGSTRGPLPTPIVAMAATPDARGYWLAAAGGRVRRFGDAQLYGSATSELFGDRVVAMAAAADGRGYWLATSRGKVFAFGDAHDYGSATGELAGSRVVAMAATPDAKGYWLAAANGLVLRFGDARLYGSASSEVSRAPIVAMTPSPDGAGYWLLPTRGPAQVGLPAPGPGFVPGHVTAIGDSVMLDAQPALEADIPGIDVEAAVSRQWYEGIEVAQELKAEGRLGAIVVIDLGTNGPVSDAMFVQMMQVLSGASRVVFVTVHLPSSYSWSQSVNATLRHCVALYPRDRLADFNKLADENPQWFYQDGVHMPIGGVGAQAMARVIKAQI